MRDSMLLVLITLSEGPRHGYAIQREIEARAGVRLGPGTLYGAIGRLEAAGFVVALDHSDRRQPYRITPAGRRELTQRLARVRAVTAWANAVQA